VKPANRLFLYGPFLVAAIALCAWFFVWRAGADSMREALFDFAEAQEANGAKVDHEPLRAKGFPFYLRGAVGKFSIVSGDDAYECENVFVDALPYQLDRIIFSCGGVQRATIDGMIWTISAPEARASVEKDRKRGWIIRTQSGAVKAESNAGRYAFDSLNLNFGPDKDDPAAFDISLRALGVEISKAPETRIDRLDAAIRLSPVDAFSNRRINVLGFEAQIDESLLKAEGALVNRAGSIEGRLDANLEKPVGLARAIANFGSLTEEETRAAEAGVAMLAVASGGAIAAPIVIENGEVSLAGLMLGRIGRADQP